MLRQYIHKMNHVFGNPDSKIVMEVYEDFECEYCGRAFRELKALREYFKEEMCLIYKHFPIIRMHPSALLAAQIAEACSLQQKYLEAHDLIFEYQEFLEYGLGGIIRLLKKDYFISIEQLNVDLKEVAIRRNIDDDIESGKQLGIMNTPAIFINGLMYKGAVKFDSIAKVLKVLIFEFKMNSIHNKKGNKRA